MIFLRKTLLSIIILISLHSIGFASVISVFNPNTISFNSNGRTYNINPQRMTATCDGSYCYIKAMGKTLKVSQQYFVDLSALERMSSGSRTEASAPCLSCSQIRETLSSNSLQRLAVRSSGFIKATNGTISSEYGPRIRRGSQTARMHTGVDIAARGGSPVVASKAGRIIDIKTGCRVGNSSCGGGYGNYILIDHGDGTKSRYAHLNSSCRLPRRGAFVSQGEQIGCVGTTGRSTGNHLHFEIIINNRTVNPLNYISGSY